MLVFYPICRRLPAWSSTRSAAPSFSRLSSASSQALVVTLYSQVRTFEPPQKVFNLIDKLQSGSAQDYAALSNSCTTVCEDVRGDLGLDFGDITPDRYSEDLYRNFSPDVQHNPLRRLGSITPVTYSYDALCDKFTGKAKKVAGFRAVGCHPWGSYCRILPRQIGCSRGKEWLVRSGGRQLALHAVARR